MQKFFAIFVLFFMQVVVEIEKEIILPALPNVMEQLGVNYTMSQSLVYLNLFGFCATCLFSASFFENYGYRFTLLGSCFVFTLASALASITSSLSCLIVGRFLQGAAAVVISSGCLALISSNFSFKDSTKIIGYLKGSLAFVSGASPLLGVWIITSYGWEYAFIFIFIFALLGFVFLFLAKKSFPGKVLSKSLLKKPHMQRYREVFTEKRFIIFSFVPALTCANYFVYISNAPYIFMQQLHVSRFEYGVYQSLAIFSFSLFCILSSSLTKSLARKTVELYFLAMGSLVLLVLSAIYYFHKPSPFLVAFLSSIYFGICGPSFSNFISYSLQRIDGLEIYASALGILLRLGIAAIFIWFISYFSAEFAIGFMAIISTLSFSLVWWERKSIFSSQTRAL